MRVVAFVILVGIVIPARGDDGLPDFVAEYCLDCHQGMAAEAGVDLHDLLGRPVTADATAWETVVRRLATRQMPPVDARRPSESAYETTLASLIEKLDSHAQQQPDPGRTTALRRLTRLEYQNAIRDLLGLRIDATLLLPADESSQGFDNITVGELSPALLQRYISAARKVSRLALGRADASPAGLTIRLPADRTQEAHVPGLPLGTRGGVLLQQHFPQDGLYEVEVRLTRDRNEQVEGLREKHELDFLVDGRRVRRFTVKPPADQDFSRVDAHLRARVRVAAGARKIGVTFVCKGSSLIETKRQPYEAHFNMHRHPRLTPAVYQVSITGPYGAEGPGDTESRRRILFRQPGEGLSESECARLILERLLRRAFRRAVGADDINRSLALYREGHESGGFEAGIERALASILVSPEFLFRIELDPPGLAEHSVYAVSDVDLASRLSFFLWSSIPDEALLEDALAGRLSDESVLQQHVRRMLRDPKSDALVDNFASQWLYLRNLDSTTPDLRSFPDFDDNLREAMRTETKLLFRDVVRDDLSVLRLIDADYCHLNERLAKHYGIPHVYGSRFRKVHPPGGQDAPPGSKRGGLLRQGSILTVTSYATRTSPVIRGHWILKNLLAAPPPPPPANVPALKDNTVDAALSVRQRLAQHRADPACTGCHQLMDPVGFALENYDAVGRWRENEEDQPVDASGSLPDGARFNGPDGLEQALLARPQLFVGALSEKLLTYALGRVIRAEDAPAIRGVVRSAEAADYRFSDLILALVRSPPFRMRKTP